MAVRRPLPVALIVGALVAAAASLGSSAAAAATLQVRPLGLTLDRASPVGRLTVANPGSDPVLLQADAYDWTQGPDGNRLVASRELLVNPAVFRIPPGGRQTVRVGLRAQPASPAASERAFRLILREVAAAAPTPGRLRFSLEISIPIFLGVPAPAAPRLEWTLGERPPEGALALAARNVGAVHAVVTRLRVRGPAGDWHPATRMQRGLYVLPGATRRWRLDAPDWPAGTPLIVEAEGPRGPVRATLVAP